MTMLSDRCPWYVAGPLLGLVIVGLRAFVNKPLGALGGYIDVAENARIPSRLGFSSFVLLGFVIGGFLYALLSGKFMLTIAYGRLDGVLGSATAAELAVLGAAGTVMGFGARMAGGCTSGHGMCGTSLGSPASLVATATFFGTAVGVAHLLALLGLS
jgi:uncharacterized membrane protein YedE/YeeE